MLSSIGFISLMDPSSLYSTSMNLSVYFTVVVFVPGMDEPDIDIESMMAEEKLYVGLFNKFITVHSLGSY